MDIMMERIESLPYHSFKENYSKFYQIANYTPIKHVIKHAPVKHFNDTIESNPINKEICGKKRLHYESCYSSESAHSTPKLYEEVEQEKQPSCPGTQGQYKSYHSEPESPVNVYEKFYHQQEEEEEQDEIVENNPGIRIARSERGLKRLSVKVRDLVYKLKESSYKDVANRLIDELVTDNEYDENGRKLDKKTSNDK